MANSVNTLKIRVGRCKLLSKLAIHRPCVGCRTDLLRVNWQNLLRSSHTAYRRFAVALLTSVNRGNLSKFPHGLTCRFVLKHGQPAQLDTTDNPPPFVFEKILVKEKQFPLF